jgi:hypothetical protein
MSIPKQLLCQRCTDDLGWTCLSFHGCHELGSFDFDGFLAAVLILMFKADDDTILYIGGTAYAQLYVFLMVVIKP